MYLSKRHARMHNEVSSDFSAASRHGRRCVGARGRRGLFVADRTFPLGDVLAGVDGQCHGRCQCLAATHRGAGQGTGCTRRALRQKASGIAAEVRGAIIGIHPHLLLGRRQAGDSTGPIGPGRIVLILRQGDSREDTDDRHDDHELYQCETVL